MILLLSPCIILSLISPLLSYQIDPTLKQADLTASKQKELFAEFKTKLNRVYANTNDESIALGTFGASLRRIIDFNTNYPDKTVKFGVNGYADMRDADFTAKVANFKPEDFSSPFVLAEDYEADVQNLQTLPESFDWRSRNNTVAAIRTQGICGCSYAFSAVAVLQGALNLKNGGSLIQPSEAQLCDCAQGTAGCLGGTYTKTFSYLRDKGISAEASYPAYTQTKAFVVQCQALNRPNNLKITGASLVSPRTADGIKAALVSKGPVAVALKIGLFHKYYDGGVFQSDDCMFDWGYLGWSSAVIIGYGSENNKPYWILRHAWGPGFGENGYIRIARGNDLCLLESSHPFVFNV